MKSPPGPPRVSRWRGRAASIGVALFVLWAAPAAVLAASWQVTSSPSTVAAGSPTEVVVKVTNTGGTQPSEQIGCVTVDVDLAFTVTNVRIVSTPAGKSWLASKSLLPPTRVTAHALTLGDRIIGGANSESVAAGITVLGTVPGTYSWTVTAYSDVDCTKGHRLDPVQKIAVTIVLLATPSPSPTPTPEPTPTSTPTSSPTPTPTLPLPTPTLPLPTPTLPLPTPTLPLPTATPTLPLPTATPTLPLATATPTTEPTVTLVPSPEATPTPSPTASFPPSPTPEPTPVPASGGTNASPGSPAPPLLPRAGPDVFALGARESDGAQLSAIELGPALIAGVGVLRWAVPAFALSVPGLIVIVAVLAQIAGGLAWLPLVRRKIGSFGPSRGGKTIRA